MMILSAQEMFVRAPRTLSMTSRRAIALLLGGRDVGHTRYASDEVLGIPEAGRGNSLVLLVGEAHALADEPLHLMGHLFIADRKTEYLRHRAGEIHHGQLTFPGFA